MEDIWFEANYIYPMADCGISIASTLEIRQCCCKPSIRSFKKHYVEDLTQDCLQYVSTKGPCQYKDADLLSIRSASLTIFLSFTMEFIIPGILKQGPMVIMHDALWSGVIHVLQDKNTSCMPLDDCKYSVSLPRHDMTHRTICICFIHI